jgi:anaerobic selenocysteine-containing dehydrogenase
MADIERASVCTLDCPDTCSLTVTVSDGRIAKVRGSEALPFTAGVICNKVARHTVPFVHGPGRLTRPLRRLGPKGSKEFATISWQSALDLIHERVTTVIGRWGREAVMPLNYATSSGRRSFTAAPCAGPCAARRGLAPMAQCRASDPKRHRQPS